MMAAFFRIKRDLKMVRVLSDFLKSLTFFRHIHEAILFHMRAPSLYVYVATFPLMKVLKLCTFALCVRAATPYANEVVLHHLPATDTPSTH